MKDFFKGLAVVTAALIVFPAVPCFLGKFYPLPRAEAVEADVDAGDFESASTPVLGDVHVYDEPTGRIITLSAEEYVAEALAAQLSPDAHRELLKAQAVVMYTYILKRRYAEAASPTPGLSGCDVGTDVLKYPRLASGEDIDLEPYREIVRETAGEYLSYEGEPITVAYCRAAGLSTESAKTVLGTDIPYLISVATNEPDAYYTTVSYTSDEVFARLTTTDKGYVLLGDPSGWLTIHETADSGYIKTLLLDSRFEVSGSEAARLLNLPSARFTFRYSSATDRFTFTVSGSGSLAGLSLRGAGIMAASGSSYREILAHYFPGTELCPQPQRPPGS